jgi:chorismate mutase
MGEAMRHHDEPVIGMGDYLRDTLRKIDQNIAVMLDQREDLARRIAVIEAAENPAVAAAVEDYEARVAEDRDYEDARMAQDIIAEAVRRYGG